jgi:hypothetical protein
MGKRLKAVRRALGSVVLALGCMSYGTAYAAAACDFTVNSVMVGNNSNVTLYATSTATSTAKTFATICSLNANATVTVQASPLLTSTVAPDTCKAVYSGLLTAKYSSATVKLYLYDLTNCMTAADITNASNPYAFRY